MLSLLAAAPVELEGFGGLDMESDYWSQCELTYTGIGRDNTLDTMSEMDMSSGIDGFLSVGFAGSIDPEFGPGDLCLVDEVESVVDGDCYTSDRQFRKRAELALGKETRTCGLLTLKEAATESEEKRALEGESSPIVDQETYWEAKTAEEHDLPFLGLRVVFDEIDRTLPPEDCYDESGGIRPGRTLAWLLRSPGRLGTAPGMFRNTVKARKRLASAIDAVVPALLR